MEVEQDDQFRTDFLPGSEEEEEAQEDDDPDESVQDHIFEGRWEPVPKQTTIGGSIASESSAAGSSRDHAEAPHGQRVVIHLDMDCFYHVRICQNTTTITAAINSSSSD